VVAVVGALDLDDQLAAGEAAREVDGVHRGLRAGVREAPLRQAPAAAQLLGDLDRAVGRGGEVRALVHALLDGLGDHRVGVADAHDAEAVVEVEVLVAVDVPDLRALAALDVDGPRVVLLELARDAARHDAAGPLEVLARAGGPLSIHRAHVLRQGDEAVAVDRGRHGGRGAHESEATRASPRSRCG
jgi:hypothetical protein